MVSAGMGSSEISERRLNQLVRSCAWCGRVHTGLSGWQREQRSIPPPATHSICPTCAVEYRNRPNAS